jgi:hypothetical protein
MSSASVVETRNLNISVSSWLLISIVQNTCVSHPLLFGETSFKAAMVGSPSPSELQPVEAGHARHSPAHSNHTGGGEAEGDKTSPATGTQKVYAAVSAILFQLATFAGGLTFATQFIITCSESRLQILLGIASQLFLGSLLGLVVVFFLMYGFGENEPLPPNVHAAVLVQFMIVGIMNIAAFVLLVVSVLVAGNVTSGIFGLVLLGVFVIGSVVLGIMVWWKDWKSK